MNAFEIKIPSDPKFAKIIRDSVGHVCMLCGLSRPKCRAVTLAVDEAVTNIIKHAYKKDFSQVITVRCKINSDRLEIALLDRGIKADPGKMKSRKLSEVRPGGLGLHFIKSTMDIVEYETSEKKGNQLTLVKFIKENGRKSVRH